MREIFHVTTVNSGVQTPESKDYLELPDMAALYHMCEKANSKIARDPKALHVSLEHEDVVDGNPITKKAIGGYINRCFIADTDDGSKRLMANLSLHVSDEKGPGEPMGDLIQEMLRYVSLPVHPFSFFDSSAYLSLRETDMVRGPQVWGDPVDVDGVADPAERGRRSSGPRV